MNQNTSYAHQATAFIQSRVPSFKPRIGIVLGSGLGGFTEQLNDPIHIPYEQLPGFPQVTVHGHVGQMVLGSLGSVEVVCLQGRSHTYEGHSYDIVKTYVRTLKLLGCEYFLATNASGSLNETMGPGQLMLITDHINMQPSNPLIGHNDDAFGPRFYSATYDAGLCEKLIATADKEGITLHQGVYLSVSGPHYETAAEIRSFRTLGANAVGMSTVPEVLVAAHCGMKIAAIATITNYATGLSSTAHSHESVVNVAAKAGETLNRLITQFVIGLA